MGSLPKVREIISIKWRPFSSRIGLLMTEGHISFLEASTWLE
jgi:hypothetical protein